MTTPIKAWHFLREDRRFRYGDDNKAEVGYVYSVDPPIEMCRWGLHASKRACDAFNYAPGPVIARVLLSGEIKHADDKLCATHREYLWIADASDALRAHARWCALQVIELWDAPDVVRRYLEYGDDALRVAAWDAAWAAARAAAGDAARDAAWAAARAAARAAAWDAAGDAARAAAWAAARDAAGDAARAAAWAAQNADLESRLFAMGAPQ